MAIAHRYDFVLLFDVSSDLGNASAHDLFDRIAVRRQAGVEVPRAFADYTVLFDGQPVAAGAELPVAPGVTLMRRC